ncbi:MAG: hypothetical protein JWQ44_2719 [Chthoniobacter sp.]|nr:hypothetical protein [Chthoniobacter sp.]
MFSRIRRAADQTGAIFRKVQELQSSLRSAREALGRIELRQLAQSASTELASHEFQVYSQWGEDGIIQRLLRDVPVKRQLFVEFGVQDYTESNTRFLLVNNNWAGLVIDASAADIGFIKRDPIYWRHNLKAVEAFITRENINDLLRTNGVTGDIGLLSVDIDGIDYWVWEAIDCVSPALVIAEYNSRFGPERSVTVAYDAGFVREKAHSSSAYYGASLAALVGLGRRKGYAFVGSNSAGSNAFFVRRDLLPSSMRELSVRDGYVGLQFREARDAQGKFADLSPEDEAALVNALPLVEVPL